MKKSLTVAALSGLVVSGVMLAAGFTQPPPPPGGEGGQPPARQPGGGRGQPGGPGGRQAGPGLEGSMKGMDRALDALKSNIGDAAKKDENLRLLSDAERFCASAKAARPTDALNDAKDEAERSRLLTDFRRRLLAVLKTLIEAEEATMDGQTDKARAALEKVASMRDAAHKEFKVMDDADKPGEPPARTPPARRSGGENPPPQR